eukprot:jgi/Picre1/32810/NNA_008140.t1
MDDFDTLTSEQQLDKDERDVPFVFNISIYVEYYIFLCADRTISMGLYQQNMSSKEGENVPTMNVNQESATMRKDTGGRICMPFWIYPRMLGVKRSEGRTESGDQGTSR